MQFDPKQQEAIDKCLDTARRAVAVSGPAGSGKTTLIKKVYEELTKKGFCVALAAPTGKAARRITQSTGIQAVTIHKLLEYTSPIDETEEVPKKNSKGEIIRDKNGDPVLTTVKSAKMYSYPRRDATNRLEENVILVDEYAMVNSELHKNLVQAMPPGSVLRAFGDLNQLQPIEDIRIVGRESGSPFQRLIEKCAGVVLDKIHRQGEGSGIVSNGWRILQGRSPIKTHDFSIAMSTKVHDSVMQIINNSGVDYASIDNQVIVVSHKGNSGSKNMNKLLQEHTRQINNPDKFIEFYRKNEKEKTRIYLGDKVIYTKNNYDLGVMNGDVGVATDIDDKGDITVDFDTIGEVKFSSTDMYIDHKGKHQIYDSRVCLDLAYALTTHKCQGSEYENIIYIISEAGWKLRNRRNFYTGITRARTHCTVVSTTNSFSYALYNKGDDF